jgi:small-conductance mechanosensitive channel
MVSTRTRRPRFYHLEEIIAHATLGIGWVAAVAVGFLSDWLWAAGIAIGTVLAWFNFRWLRQGTDALRAAMTSLASGQKARVPVSVYFKTVFRYGLMALIIYVIFRYLKVPILSMITGLFALGAAAIAASMYEVLRPLD